MHQVYKKKKGCLALLGDGADQHPSIELGKEVDGSFHDVTSVNGLPKIDLLHDVFPFWFVWCFPSLDGAIIAQARADVKPGGTLLTICS